MKVGIVNRDFSLGGAQRVAIEVAKGLSSNDEYDVDVIAFVGERQFFYNDIGACNRIENTSKKRIIEKIRHRLSAYHYKFLKKQYKISRMFQNQINGLASIFKKEKYDIVILCQGDLTALIPTLKNQFPSIKFIAWQHNSYDIYMERYHVAYLEEYLMGLRQADEVICLTKQDQQLFRKHNEKAKVIHNPLTISTHEISDLKNNTIVFVSRIDIEQKGLDYLVELVKRSPDDWNYVIAGDGLNIVEFKKLIMENNINNKITLKGALHGEDLVNHYLNGSIFISTSRWEGFGLVITEAMSCGLPVISFDNSGPREIMNDGEYGILINKYDIDHFYSELEKLMKDENLRKIYQQKSIQRASDFSLEIIIKKWMELM